MDTRGTEVSGSVLRSQLLGYFNDEVSVEPYGDGGFLIWMPLFHSSGDGVSLTVRPESGGWLVSDDGTTLAALDPFGELSERDRFQESWGRLARPGNGHVPADSVGPEIAAWAPASDLAGVVFRVLEASLRAEGLAYCASKSVGRSDASSMVYQAVADVAPRVQRNAKITMRSGRTRQVTAGVMDEHDQLRVAVQAMTGRTRELRNRSHDTAYSIFGTSRLPRERRLVVAVGSHSMWESFLIAEVEEVAVVRFLDDPDSVYREIGKFVDL